MNYTIPLITLFFLFSSLSRTAKEWINGDTAPTPTSSSVYIDGEDLVYEVSWTFVKLGTVHIKTLGNLKAAAYIDSYDGLPFVDLHSVNFTKMDSSFYCRSGYAIDKDGNDWIGLDYSANPGTGRVAIERLTQHDPSSPPFKREPMDTIRLNTRSFVDGLSIGYFPRLFIHSVRTVNVTTLLKGNVGTTTFYFTDNRTTESIDALDDPVRVVEVEGTTNAVGVFGMTGDFTGWFSDDACAVPIKGKLKVLLGSVTIELVKWNRKGWKPPQ